MAAEPQLHPGFSLGRSVADHVIKEGWCTKESGQAFLGKTNWQKRWFRLVQRGSKVVLSYYKKIEDKQPAGYVILDSTYCTRELEIGEKKNKPNCFAVGPITEDGTLRTYYLYCETEDEKLEWIVVINATIEGVPELAEKRKMTVRQKFLRRSQRKANFRPNVNKNDAFMDASWRKEQWSRLCSLADMKDWKKSDTKNGITVARLSFSKNDYAIIKTEGCVNVPPDIIYDYLQRAIRGGGKLDFVFRNEDILQSVTGLLLLSVDHSSAPQPTQESQCVITEPSGIILRPEYSKDGTLVTRMVVIVQINVQGSLQTMLEGSFKSGLLKIGLRTAFSYVSTEIEKYMQSFLN